MIAHKQPGAGKLKPRVKITGAGACLEEPPIRDTCRWLPGWRHGAVEPDDCGTGERVLSAGSELIECTTESRHGARQTKTAGRPGLNAVKTRGKLWPIGPVVGRTV